MPVIEPLHDADCPMTNARLEQRTSCVCELEPGGHEAVRIVMEGGAARGICQTCGAGPHGRCQLEGDGDCPEGCVTPEQW